MCMYKNIKFMKVRTVKTQLFAIKQLTIFSFGKSLAYSEINIQVIRIYAPNTLLKKKKNRNKNKNKKAPPPKKKSKKEDERKS